MLSKNRPILPEPKTSYDEATGMDGEYDFSDANPDSRTKYKARVQEVTFELDRKRIDCRDPRIVRIYAHSIARWLACGEQYLIFDDETAVFYMARVINKLDLETQIQAGRPFTVQFKCSQPFGNLVTKSSEQIKFGQGLMLGYGLRLDMVPTVFTVMGYKEINVYNPGTYVKPVIEISGAIGTISFTCNGKTISYNTAFEGDDLAIDCQKKRAIIAGTVDSTDDTSGDFVEFIQGDNILEIDGTSLNCTVTIDFRAQYL
jgi:predicted phage tail component-like protein